MRILRIVRFFSINFIPSHYKLYDSRFIYSFQNFRHNKSKIRVHYIAFSIVILNVQLTMKTLKDINPSPPRMFYQN